jgi:D-methionine transport system permease protein
MFEAIDVFFDEYGLMLAKGTLDTLIMTTISTLVAYAIGIPIAVGAKITEPGGLQPQRALNAVLGWIINIGRSIPFIIMMVVLIPFSRFVMHTSIGVQGAIVPLSVAAIPFVARMVESSFSEVHPGRIEAAQAFGANTFQIITKVYLNESLPSLIRGGAITYITVFGYSTIAGAIGAGGLGDIAVRYGYYRYQDDVLIVSLVILIVVIQIIQSVFDLVARRIDKR